MFKKILGSLVLSVFVVSCASSQKSKERIKESAPAPKVSKETVEVVPQKEEQVSPRQEAPIQSQGPRFVNVWVDSLAFDFILAIGFLQELERNGFQIKSVVGSGSACLLAAAYGQRGSLNEAEYQSFKLDEIPSAGKGELLAKLKSTKSTLQEILQRNYPGMSLSNARVPVSCAFVKGGQLHLERRGTVVEILGASLEVPRVYGSLPVSANFGYPANFMMAPAEDDLNKARALAANSSPWLVIKTFDHSEFLLNENSTLWHLLYKFKGVSEKNSEESSLQWQKVNLSRYRNIKSSDLFTPSQRRSFLLQGREAGKKWTAPAHLFLEI